MHVLDIFNESDRNFLNGTVSEADIGSQNLEAWKQKIQAAYPQERGRIMFVSKDNGKVVSAEIPGLDRSYGVFDMDTEQGQVLGEQSTTVDEALKPQALTALQQAKQAILQNRESELASWEQDFRKNTASKYNKTMPQRQAQQPRTPVAQPGEKHSALKARLAQLNSAIEKQKYLDFLTFKAEQKGLVTPGLTADIDTSLYVRDGAKDNYQALHQKIDKSIEILKSRLGINKLAYKKPAAVREAGRSSWDSNMPGYQGDYGGAENWGRREREDDEHHEIDRRREQQLAQYNQSGKFWLKLKDSQRHLPAGPFIGKPAANAAAVELLKKQPELKGNLVITAYGPDEQQVTEGRVKELAQDLKDRAMSDEQFKSKYGKTRAEVRAAMREKQGVAEGMLDNPGAQDSPVASAITRRILLQRTDLLAKYGPEKVGAAVDEVADFVGDVDEIGSSDVSGWIRHVEQMLGNMAEGVAEDKGMSGYNKFKKEWRAKHGDTKPVPGYDSKEYTSYIYQQNDKKKGVAEGEKTMSRAAKGYEKYGKEGMAALARAGREGASEKKMDAIRDKHDKYNEGYNSTDDEEEFFKRADHSSRTGIAVDRSQPGKIIGKLSNREPVQPEKEKKPYSPSTTKDTGRVVAHRSGAVRAKLGYDSDNPAYSRVSEEGTSKKPRIRKYAKMRPDGSKAVRYEVLDHAGRRVSGQGVDGFDDLKNAKQFYYRNYDRLMAPVDENIDSNPADTVEMDIPLLLRVMEYSKEDAKTDMDLHRAVTKLIALSKSGKTLTVQDYQDIVAPEATAEPEETDNLPMKEDKGRYWCKVDKQWKDKD